MRAVARTTANLIGAHVAGIVDAHFHLGTCRVFDADVDEDRLLATQDAHGIGVSIVQPYPGAPDAAAAHDRIAALARSTAGRVVGLASLSPHVDADAYFAEVSRCVRELGFVGVKLHTIGHAVNPRGRDAEKVFETARQLDIPVMVHTGPGVPFADPAQVVPRLRQFPEVTVVLAHAGAGIFTGSAIAVAETFDNVVLETSWCRAPDLAAMVAALGPDRVLFGSDHPYNAGAELAKYRSGLLTDVQLTRVLGGAARDVFALAD